MIKNGKNHSATYHDQNKKVFPKSRNDSRTLNWVIESLYKEIFGAILGSIQIAQPVREQLFGRTTVCTNSCSREQLFTQKVVTRSYDSTECESSSSHHRKHGWFRSLQLETNNTPPKTNGLCTTFES